MNYKINYLRCYWDCYKKVKIRFADKIDNDTIGTILFYLLYYICSLLGLLIFVFCAFVVYVKNIKIIKSSIKQNNTDAIESLLKNKFIKGK